MPIYAPVYCEPPALTHPALPIAALTARSAAADTMRAYAATVEILKGAVDDRDAVIAGCASPAGNALQAPAPTPTAPAETSHPGAPRQLTTRVINAARAMAGFTFGE
ncbi:MAG: hypothetical protein IVW56_02435 [Candidatus Binataceae bacterium]|nr:hypothetical protein [Candidatus Binataceae bacterium]